MALFPSDEWLTRYRDLINGSQEYGEAAEDWEGDVAFFLEAEPDRGVPEDLVAWLDLWHGECRGSRMITADEGERKLKLRGDLANIVRHVRAAKELVHLTTLVPTEFLGSA